MRALVILVALAACGNDTRLAEETTEAAKQYPTITALYEAEQGVYRGCGPSGGVCHNGNEFPNLDSLGSIVDNINRGCNQKRMDATTVHDLCEQAGDRLVLGDQDVEIAWIEEPMERTWKLHLREPMAGGAGEAVITRGARPIYFLDAVEMDETGDVVVAVAAPVVDPEDDPEFDLGTVLSAAGAPGDPAAIRVGDPNRNGVYGSELGGRLIKPGDPSRSYLLTRLLDPSAGPLMPRANCCQWSKPAVRALYCWVEGLAADGSNAYAPIDYLGCSAGPPVELLYPEPGPGCEQMGMCPVEAVPVE